MKDKYCYNIFLMKLIVGVVDTMVASSILSYTNITF